MGEKLTYYMRAIATVLLLLLSPLFTAWSLNTIGLPVPVTTKSYFAVAWLQILLYFYCRMWLYFGD